MSFIETLRKARESRVAVLHEFWTQYNPSQARVHAFFEGHEDIVFLAPHIERHLPAGYRLVPYRCEGKGRVYEAFADITAKNPNVKSVLFFVDKDIDDILGTPWPTDPRIYVTDVYSIENYVVTADVLRRMLRDGVRAVGVSFDEDAIIAEFEKKLSQYQGKLLTLMAWIVLARRAGERPNLKNLHMKSLWILSTECVAVRCSRRRTDHMATATGVRLTSPLHGRLRLARKELARVPVKRVVRGKYELWFFVEFWRVLLQHLQSLATEASGKVQVKLAVTHDTALRVAVPYVETPKSLDLFLRAHLSDNISSDNPTIAPRGSLSLWERIKARMGIP